MNGRTEDHSHVCDCGRGLRHRARLNHDTGLPGILHRLSSADLGGTQSPPLLALGWGILAPWWAGMLLGIFLAVASRWGSPPKLVAWDLLPWVRTLLLVMAVSAVLAGVAGFFWGRVPRELEPLLSPRIASRFAADLWAHTASYATGSIGGLIVCGLAHRGRHLIVHY